MPLENIGARVRHTSAFSFVSKLVSSFVIISVLAVSMPAAPRMLVDAAPKVPQVLASIDSSLHSFDPTQFASDIRVPAVDTTPLLGFFHNAAAFAVGVKSVVLPNVPAGLENAKLPTFNERTFAFFSPILALFTSSTTSAPTAASSAAPPQPTSVVDFDFDNDGKADIGRWHGALSDYDYKVRNSNGGSYSSYTFTTTGGKIAPGDFNGDGKTDASVFNAGTWTYKTSTSATAQTISFGITGDIPVAGDYDGDGTTDAAIYRPSTNTWWIRKSSNGSGISTTFGIAGDITVPGDYDGDGKNDLALFRPSTGDWHITGSTAGYSTLHWGLGTDTPVPADFDGDGKTDQAVFRPSTGTWYVNRSDNGPFYQQAWGNYRDQPVPADYDGDGKADYAIWRPTTGVWYIRKSSDSNFEMYTLGAPGDTAVPSAYLKQVGGEVTGDALNAARLSPRNATGGTDLYSQNFGWGTSLVNLPGRAGLDANLGISYNSLVWTKVGNAMVFDADNSNVTPGFRLGLPVIEPIYYDTDNSKNTWAYMMVTPSGGRVQFRQTVVTNVYETADSNYTQLVVNGASNPNTPSEDVWLLVRTTDGTQMTYSWSLGAYRCTQIKDRNGNYISIAYNGEGQLSTITDTLGRVITVGYDSATGLPSTITQTWKDNNGAGPTTSTHTWATLTYADLTISTSFDSSLTVVGAPNGTVIKVLDRVTYADGSSTRFDYNGYAQVYKVRTVAADSASHVLNYLRTNLQTPASNQPDCPRFTETKSFVENFNSGNEVTVTNTAPTSSSYSLPGGISGTAAKIEVVMAGHPDGLYSRTYVGESGWKEGLTLATEDCIGTNCSDRKRWTWTNWTQDNANPLVESTLPYILNPRIVESRVGDGTNTRKSTVEYWLNTDTNIAAYGLVKSAFTYHTDLNTVLKQTYTTYNLDSAYTSRRIIGLPSMHETWGREMSGSNVISGLTLTSKVTFDYDLDDDFNTTGLDQNVSPVQHDGAYGASFSLGRGNLTSTRRWDVTDADNENESVVSSTKYNTAGSVVSKTDAVGRVTKIGYTDSFNSTVGVSTYAYPTTFTDAANNSSTIIYRYDIGANVEANSPAPFDANAGKTTKRRYDDKGRILRDSIYNGETEYSYTRYAYEENGVQSQVYSTIADADGEGGIEDDEALFESWSDGAGRIYASRTAHPGSSGGWGGNGSGI